MSQNKPKPQKAQRKRLQIADATGWTHVIKGSRNQHHQHLLPTSLQPTEVEEGLTLEKVVEIHDKCLRRWRESDCLTNLERILKKEVLTSKNLLITRCVCLGLGSLTKLFGDRSKSWYELATLISVLEILGEKHEIKEIFIQDPMFNHLDEAFLKTLGYTVLKTPDAFAKMTPETFLFDPCLEWTYTAMAFAVALPSFRIGNNLSNTNSQSTALNDREQALFQHFLATRSMKSMPTFHTVWLFTTAIYWVSDSESDSVVDHSSLDTTIQADGGISNGKRISSLPQQQT